MNHKRNAIYTVRQALYADKAGRKNGMLSALFVVAIALPSIVIPIRACDFCNCVIGINPFYSGMNRIGFTFLYQQSHIPGGEELNPGSKPISFGYGKLYHGGGSVDEHGLTVAEREQRMTFELSYQHHLSKHLVLTALLPFTTTQVESTESFALHGMGDGTLLGYYAVTGLFSNQTPGTLMLGGGVELPTGKNNMRHDDGDLIDSRLQPGSGSVDFVANALLTLPIHDWTLAFDGYGKLNGANSRDDRIGNSLSITGAVSRDLYRNNLKNMGVIGVVGVRGEFAERDRVAGEIDGTTGAQTLWGNLGAELVLGAVKVNASALLPLLQHRETGGADEDVRLTAGIRYEFE